MSIKRLGAHEHVVLASVVNLIAPEAALAVVRRAEMKLDISGLEQRSVLVSLRSRHGCIGSSLYQLGVSVFPVFRRLRSTLSLTDVLDKGRQTAPAHFTSAFSPARYFQHSPFVSMNLALHFVFIASLTTLIPTAQALLGTPWTVTNVPSDGLTDITFPLTILAAEHFSGYYFAQQFSFGGNDDIGYTGLQPRPDDTTGRPFLMAVFSSFINGTTTTDANCFAGADGGPGVSCSIEFPADYNHTYELEVVSAGAAGLWNGSVVDTVSNERKRIGSWTLPTEFSGSGIQGAQTGFVEWYPWNVEIPADHCALLPYQKTRFGAPRTTNAGSVGSQGAAYEYGDCFDTDKKVGTVAFHTESVADGVEIEVGFKGKTGVPGGEASASGSASGTASASPKSSGNPYNPSASPFSDTSSAPSQPTSSQPSSTGRIATSFVGMAALVGLSFASQFL
ncbi:hypothetical protein C8R43DRAFT_1118665 [Mycena crocata]|nr:hypothetical protein C8R43DRAFT_1118665 [Mycena crocata]